MNNENYAFLKSTNSSCRRFNLCHLKYRALNYLTLLIFVLGAVCLSFMCSKQTVLEPLRVVVDLNVGESQKVKLSSGGEVDIKLIEVKEICDDVRLAIRSAQVKVNVNGEEITLNSANYNLPVSVADVQLDCPITKGYYRNSRGDPWALEKDARLRLWHANSPFIAPGTFVYPVKQPWFANDTQMCNEPCYVDWGEDPSNKESIYYHYGLDFGGSEDLVEIVSAYFHGLPFPLDLTVTLGFRRRYSKSYCKIEWKG